MAIDPDKLYGVYDGSAKRHERLNDSIVRKALNLPLDDEVQINTVNNSTPWWQLALAMVLSSALTALGTYHLASQPRATPSAPPAQQRYKVTFTADDDDTNVSVKSPTSP